MNTIRRMSAIVVWILTPVSLYAIEDPDSKGPANAELESKECGPQTRVFVWAKPGVSGAVFDLENWTEYASANDYTAGKPGRSATKAPDAETDLDEGIEIHGDVTVKEGGYIYGKLIFAGRKHTFFRVDNSREPLASEITVRKVRDAGITLLARQYDLGRGVTVESGSLVLGPGTRLRFNATYKAREQLGKFGEYQWPKVSLLVWRYPGESRERMVGPNWLGESGMPERPITRDMLFPVAGVAKDKINRAPGESHRCSGVSFFVGEQGRLITYSADPTKARVIFKMYDSERAKAKAQEWGGWDSPEGIALGFAGKTELNGVVFDNVYEGGIMVLPETRATWENVSYGKHNLAEPGKLYWDLNN